MKRAEEAISKGIHRCLHHTGFHTHIPYGLGLNTSPLTHLSSNPWTPPAMSSVLDLPVLATHPTFSHPHSHTYTHLPVTRLLPSLPWPISLCALHIVMAFFQPVRLPFLLIYAFTPSPHPPDLNEALLTFSELVLNPKPYSTLDPYTHPHPPT